MAASFPSRLYLIPIALLILGVLNALFAYSRYEQSADQQLSDQFRSDANTRILVGDDTKTLSDKNTISAGDARKQYASCRGRLERVREADISSIISC